MFNFFRRIFRKHASKNQPTVPVPADRPAEPESAGLARTRLRSDAMQNAAAFNRNEDAAVEFILQCAIADARLAAAQGIHSRPALEKVRRAMRDTDRRVAKLMQSRLDMLERQRRNAEAAAQCVAAAKALAAHPQPTPNQVAQVDRTWKAIQDVPEPHRTDFDTVRAVLTERLAGQAALQRRAIDLGARVRQTRAAFAEPLNGAPAVSLADMEATVNALAADIEQCRSAPEAASLPPGLLTACDNGLQELREIVAKAGARQAAITRRESALAAWEAGDAALLDVSALRREWKEMDAANVLKEDFDGKAASLQRRFDALIQSIEASRRMAAQAALPQPAADTQASSATGPEVPIPDPREVNAVLAALEDALEQGTLQAALTQDRILRAMGTAAIRHEEIRARVASARAKLARLQDWARWGGAVSREELVRQAQELPERETDPATLAERVGDLRTRWKMLDASAGAAPRALWEQFDAACNRAYEPAAAHFAAQAAAREANLARANALIDEVKAFALASGLAPDALPLPVHGQAQAVEWKNLAQFRSRALQQWQRLGPIGRKEKKQAQEHFDAAMQLLQEPLMREQQAAAQRREALIAEAAAIDPLQRDAFDVLRSLQQRWQEEAKALPLARNTDQLLWQRFRGACDAVVAQRRERFDVADAGRMDNLERRRALCTRLEAAADAHDMPDASIASLIRESDAAWTQAGEVPRDAQQEIDERYRRVIGRLRERIDGAKQAARNLQWQTLNRRLDLCRAAEQALLDGAVANPTADTLRMQWQSLPTLPDALQQVLQRRFDAALPIGEPASTPDQEPGAESRRALLRANRDALLQEVLRLEIMTGAETPAAFQGERLRLQVDVLQAALKSGRKAMTLGAQVAQVCSLPAATDGETAGRIKRALDAAMKAEPSAIGSA